MMAPRVRRATGLLALVNQRASARGRCDPAARPGLTSRRERPVVRCLSPVAAVHAFWTSVPGARAERRDLAVACGGRVVVACRNGAIASRPSGTSAALARSLLGPALMSRSAFLESTNRGLFTPATMLPEQYYSVQRRPLT